MESQSLVLQQYTKKRYQNQGNVSAHFFSGSHLCDV